MMWLVRYSLKFSWISMTSGVKKTTIHYAIFCLAITKLIVVSMHVKAVLSCILFSSGSYRNVNQRIQLNCGMTLQ